MLGEVVVWFVSRAVDPSNLNEGTTLVKTGFISKSHAQEYVNEIRREFPKMEPEPVYLIGAVRYQYDQIYVAC